MRSNNDFREMLSQRRQAGNNLEEQESAPDPDPERENSAPIEEFSEDYVSDWSSVTMERGQLSMQPFLLRNIINQSGSEFRHLTLAGCDKYVGDELIFSLAQKCPDLEKLDISYCDVSDDAVVALANGCRHLLELSCSGCAELTEAAFVALAEHCQSLDVATTRADWERSFEDEEELEDEGSLQI